MAKNILFILMPNYRDEEFTEPYNILKKAGHTIDVAGLEPGPTVGANGHKHQPNILLSEIKDFDHYDALVIPGGPGSQKYLWENPAVHKAIKDFHENHKIIAAICYAVIAVVKTGILLNKHATVYPTDEAKAILEEYGVRFSKDLCVALTPEKIITAQGPTTTTEFGNQIESFLKK